MKKLLFVALLLSCSIICAQDEIPIGLPNLSPQSPEAFQFTKYGEVQVNESTGVISPSIPLYTYRAGDINIPIVLSYSGNGVKVAQDPTWVGINWNLSPGGVITRQVRDEIDEYAQQRIYHTTSSLGTLAGAFNYTDNSTAWYQELELIADGVDIDSEVDIFNYNFLGYSGSFYLDANLEVHLIRYDKELRIDFQEDSGGTNTSEIVITTPDGNTYFFGGANASEISKTVAESGPASGINTDYAQNAFYLHHIALYNGGSVDFNYDQTITPTDQNIFTIGEQENLQKYVSSDINCGTAPNGYNKTESLLKLDLQKKLYLSSIDSDLGYGSVEFNYDFLLNNQSNPNKRRARLNEVLVKNEDGSLHKRFDLTYITDSGEPDVSDNRYFLTAVDFLDSGLNFIYNYEMAYSNPLGLPLKGSFDQDYNGYYNGPGSNSTLLPEHLQFTGTIALADREPSELHIKYGSLQKITYPTGGFSEFEYELPIKGYDTNVTESQSMQVYYNDPTRNNETDEEDELWDGGDAPYAFQAGDEIQATIIATVNGDLNHLNTIELQAVNSLGGNSPSPYVINLENPQNTTKFYNKPVTITINETGSYFLRLKLVLDQATIDNTVDISVNCPVQIPTTNTTPIYYPSLRVKKVTSKEADGATPLVTRYYYNARDMLDTEQNSIVKDPIYVYQSFQERNCDNGNGTPLVVVDEYLNLSTSPLNALFSDDSGKILYPYVTVSYGGDNFENGGKQLQHYVFGEGSPLPYFASDFYGSYGGNSASLANSTLLHEWYFSATPDPVSSGEFLFTDLREVEYEYQFLIGTDIMDCIKAQKKRLNRTYDHDIRDWEFGLYQIRSRKYVMSKSTTTEYLGVNRVIATRDLGYSTYVDRPHTVTTTDSNGYIYEQVLYYPKDVNTPGNTEDLDAAEIAAIQKLDDHNRIGTPYMVKEYEDTKIRASRQMIFSEEWTANRVWPKYVKTAKADDTGSANALDDYEYRVEYLEYNPFGRPTLVGQIDRGDKTNGFSHGSLTKYIYNSNQQPTLKIEGYDPAFVIDDGLPPGPCLSQEQRPLSLVTSYEYDSQTGNLLKITDPRCYSTSFEYDAANRLERVRDDQGKLLSENQYNYVTQSQQ